jgi:hypothetical protein
MMSIIWAELGWDHFDLIYTTTFCRLFISYREKSIVRAPSPAAAENPKHLVLNKFDMQGNWRKF